MSGDKKSCQMAYIIWTKLLRNRELKAKIKCFRPEVCALEMKAFWDGCEFVFMYNWRYFCVRLALENEWFVVQMSQTADGLTLFACLSRTKCPQWAVAVAHRFSQKVFCTCITVFIHCKKILRWRKGGEGGCPHAYNTESILFGGDTCLAGFCAHYVTLLSVAHTYDFFVWVLWSQHNSKQLQKKIQSWQSTESAQF